MATEIAALGLKADSSGVVKATDDLKSLAGAAGEAERAAEKLSGGARKADTAVRQEGDAARGAANDNRQLSRHVSTTEGAMLRLAKVAGTLTGILMSAFSVGAAARMADEWSDMQSVVGAAIRNMEAAPSVMNEIVRLANASYSSLEQTARGFASNVGALRDLGISTQGALDYTEALNHALVLTATKGQQAEGVQNALSKAMATGKLGAEGLETVLANGGEVANALAEELGTTVSGLRSFASNGKITGDVIANALISRVEELRLRAEEMPATIGDAFTRVGTNLTAFVGQLDQAMGISGNVSQGIMLLADNINLLAGYAAAAGLAITAMFIPSIWGAVAATGAWVAGMVTLKGVLISTGIGAFIVLAGTLIGKFLELVRTTGSVGDAFRAMGDIAGAAWKFIVDAAGAIPGGLQSVWDRVRAGFMQLVQDLHVAWGQFVSGLGADLQSRNLARFGPFREMAEDMQNAGIDIQKSAYETQGAIDALMASSEAGGKKVGETLSAAASQFAIDARIAGLGLKRLDAAFPGSLGAEEGGSASAPTIPDLGGRGRGGAAGRMSEAVREADQRAEAIQRVVHGLEEEIRLIGASETARRTHSALQQAGVELYSAEGQRIADLTERLVAMEEQQRRVDQAADGIANAFSGVLVAGESLRGGLAQVFKQIASDIMKSGIRNALMSQFGAVSGGGGLFGGLFQSFFGGGDRLTGALRMAGLPAFAKGGVFDGLSAYSNQVVDRPTLFAFANGAGLMGEAGPEAIMPLSRGADGRLGVRAEAAQHSPAARDSKLHISVEVLENGNIRAVARDEAGQVVAQSAPQLISRSVQASQKSMRKSKAPWGI